MPLASASRWARAKCSATKDAIAFEPKAIAPAHVVARISTGVALAANAATPTSAAATGAPRSMVWRSARVVGDATSIRAAGTESSRIHARSRPDQVVVIRSRLETTRAPATTGFSLATGDLRAGIEPRHHPGFSGRHRRIDAQYFARLGHHLLAGANFGRRALDRFIAADDAHPDVEQRLHALADGPYPDARTGDEHLGGNRSGAGDPSEHGDGHFFRVLRGVGPARRACRARRRQQGNGRVRVRGVAPGQADSKGQRAPCRENERDARDVGDCPEQANGRNERPRDHADPVDRRHCA